MKSPAYQTYPQDFISSLDCQMMSLEEFGAYNWLLLHSWVQEPQAMLPNNHEILAKLLRINPRTFAKMWRNTLEKKFKISECKKFLYNPRLLSEAEKQVAFREKQAENGAKGGRPPKTGKPSESQKNPGLSSGFNLGKPKKSSSTSSSISSSELEDKSSNNNSRPVSESDLTDRQQELPKFSEFISLFNRVTGRNFNGCSKSKRQFKARIEDGATLAEFEKAICNCLADPFHKENPNYLTPEFITRSDKLEKYLNAAPVRLPGRPAPLPVGFDPFAPEMP